jgi:molybdate transport system substrate-binding protein
MRAAALATGLLLAHVAIGAELKVLVAGAYKTVAQELGAAYEKRTGNKVILEEGTAGQLAKRVADGEAFDVMVVTPAVIKQLSDGGRIRGESSANVAKVGIGVAVRDGAPKPDLSSADAFRKALLDARRVAYIDPAAGGSSGLYLDKLFERMGVAAEVRAKALLVPGGRVAEKVASGEADLGIHQISEILPVKGATLVGPLPADVQNYTVYTAVVSPHARDLLAAAEFVATMRTPEAAAVLKAKGMEAP